MTKCLTMRLENGEVWAFPAEIVAKDRARYFAEKDPDTTYEAELELAMGDDYTLDDWARGNMDWKDVRPYAKKISNATAVTEDMFREAWNRGFEAVELDLVAEKT